MKIKATNETVKSMKLCVPVDGIIEINAEGLAEVSDKCGKMLVEGTNDWKEVGAGKGTEETKKVVEGEGNNPKEETTNKDDEVIKGIEVMPLQDCIEMAQQAGYPEKEWQKLAKNEKAAEKLMRNYLIKKYKDSVK